MKNSEGHLPLRCHPPLGAVAPSRRAFARGQLFLAACSGKSRSKRAVNAPKSAGTT
jgi:hypothetical protein